ncbi:hypothetical protein E6H31_03355 [Candidatus Bathyarchaeota archaeon]|nr:MAG: hypothetical protein E6H31_03355 [Candidatus Bathyarchaeota archaeon]
MSFAIDNEMIVWQVTIENERLRELVKVAHSRRILVAYAQLGRDLGAPVYYRLYGGASGPFLDELENLGIIVL